MRSTAQRDVTRRAVMASKGRVGLRGAISFFIIVKRVPVLLNKSTLISAFRTSVGDKDAVAGMTSHLIPWNWSFFGCASRGICVASSSER
ncbi:hypothetical protein E2C01_102126 [Portunus trituberculatus]|uniref:Uncharacterized protein n=1 Tax=Portunus trituberculatus TaxID=210409 RepID=A0A5B7KBR9_PORTR|nr:hypothetical protein [Portunus trituberculatus]